jgi:hypothetical protein
MIARVVNPGGRTIAAALLAGFALSACAPPFADMQSARLAGPKRVELTPGYSSVSFSEDGETEKVQDHFGLQVATGISDRVDLRARFERISVDDDGVNVIGAGPKVALLPERLALYVPVGFAFGSDIDSGDTWQVHPTLLGTVPLVADRLELNTSGKVLVPISSSVAETLVAFNMGLGIGDLSRIVVRPEVGFLFNPGESGHYRHFTIGLSYYTGGESPAASRRY